MKLDLMKEYSVWCGICLDWERTEVKNKTMAERIFRRRGWATSEGKTVCPKCKDSPINQQPTK